MAKLTKLHCPINLVEAEKLMTSSLGVQVTPDRS
ncbi:hypothetical protein COLO4_25664 [Corchorus olitorius]|uniref:Uncharacterized protein n=1 Tax=Corchorus olitorius TaxID=93759 RepID=A0A1R3I0M0_9ROSI|nr:hypothetical protein COLO4_25664 [Corchorus olitorius]